MTRQHYTLGQALTRYHFKPINLWFRLLARAAPKICHEVQNANGRATGVESDKKGAFEILLG